jgi:hypothetical protein
MAGLAKANPLWSQEGALHQRFIAPKLVKPGLGGFRKIFGRCCSIASTSILTHLTDAFPVGPAVMSGSRSPLAISASG